MRGRAILFGLGATVLAVWPAVAGDPTEMTTLTLPAGDAAAGREAFLALGCVTCHRVAGEDGLPRPVSFNPGPTLGAYQARKTPAELSLSIVAPSHEISATVRGHEAGDLSPMGDFSDVMTVRQLVDLVAYLRARAEREP